MAETATQSPTHEQAEVQRVAEVFQKQKEAFLAAGPPSYEQRMANLAKLLEQTRRYTDRIVEAIVADYGSRSEHEILLTEVLLSVNHIKYTRKRLKRWMKPERRKVDWMFKPARARVLYQPKGVVGVISPWNYPVYLTLVPLTTALAAGNRVMIKPSEITANTAELMKEMLGEIFDEREVAVFTGGPEVGAAFTAQPFGHLLFTGSTQLGRIIMKAAADNLTPVTLELGGKSPLIVHPSYDLRKAAERTVAGKYFNAGQTCVAPDYVLVHADQVDAFVKELDQVIRSWYPTLADNPDYTAIVNERHYQRLRAYVDEARERGVPVLEINPAEEPLPPEKRKIAPTLIVDPPDDLRVMQDEIFGPILPIKPYRDIDAAIEFVNRRPNPLALYYFDDDRRRAEEILRRTLSGGVCLNETMMHVAQDDLPFGGIGESGMGAYHGKEGFETFSHKRAVFIQAKINGGGLIKPPYPRWLEKGLRRLIGADKR